jgi:hypothetical protein
VYLGRWNDLWQKLFTALNLNAEIKTKTSTMYFVDEDGNLQGLTLPFSNFKQSDIPKHIHLQWRHIKLECLCNQGGPWYASYETGY